MAKREYFILLSVLSKFVLLKFFESFAFLFRTLDLEKKEQTQIDENMISEATILRFFGAFYF